MPSIVIVVPTARTTHGVIPKARKTSVVMSGPEVFYGPKPLTPLNDEMRHGFDEEYNLEQVLLVLARLFFIYYDDKRHNTNGNPITDDMKNLPKYYKNYQPITDWKLQKGQKTILAALILCLNLGVDPPDIVKTYPCAKTEAWVDPLGYSETKKALEQIGKNLQTQYENISLRTKYKQLLDPCVEDVKRFCNILRRNAKDERILFHYNGHGVPQPTLLGEIWVFNRGYTQYIPISLYDLQTWLGAPVIFVYDCNLAGNIVHNFKKFVQKRIDDDNDGNHDQAAPLPTLAYLDCIQLAACKSNELLPMNPELPADLFTCCLTSPIDISTKWFIMQLPLKKHYYDKLPKNLAGNVIIPGKLTDRRTPLGELIWIFTAITDTIAWLLLSRPIFKRLFRQELMVAALFRNFLLAKRIMPHMNCNPISDPPLPEIVAHHPMWELWDLAIDQVLSQLLHEQENKSPEPKTAPAPVPPPTIMPPENGTEARRSLKLGSVSGPSQTLQKASAPSQAQILNNYQHLSFFEQQLTAFEMWLNYTGPLLKEPPEQLPIVLQVLLSPVHRLRALILLSKFLDLGPWAVYLSLLICIFPYILKLLQSPSQDLKPVLIFIWARIMAIDYKSTQAELCKDKGFNYFYVILNNPQATPGAATANGAPLSTPLVEDHKAMSAFILTLFIKDFRNGQRQVFSSEIIGNCLSYIAHLENPLLRQWCALLLSQLWANNVEAKRIVFRENVIGDLLPLVNDPIPEVRVLIIIAFTTFLTDINEPSSREELKHQDHRLAAATVGLANDGSLMVRKELLFFMHKFIMIYEKFFMVVAFNQLEEEIVLIENPDNLNEARKKSPAYGLIFSSVWKALLILLTDPHCEVKQLAETLIDIIMLKLAESELGLLVKEIQEFLVNNSSINITEAFKKQAASPVVKLQRQNSSGLMKARNVPLINGAHPQRRVALAQPPKLSASLQLDALSIMKKISLSNLFKLFHISDDTHELKLPKVFNPRPSPINYHLQYQPLTPFFTKRDFLKPPQFPEELGFFQYSLEYFQEPQMLKNELEEAGLVEYNRLLWRRNRNEQIIQETQPQKELAIRGDWNREVRVLDNKMPPKIVKFTQFERILVASDERDTVLVWDWQSNHLVQRFSNMNPFGTKITDIKFINEDDQPLLMTGSLDGLVKIYKHYQNPDHGIELIAGWRALTDMLLSTKLIGLISEWQQSRGSLLVLGDVKVIRIWDAQREMCVADIPGRLTLAITTLTSDQVAGNIIVGGFDDGTVRVYDRRMDARDSMVRKWLVAPQPLPQFSIRNIHMQRGGFRELVLGSVNGEVQLWDIRQTLSPVVTFYNTEPLIRLVDVHEHAPIITTGAKLVNVWTTLGDLLSTLSNPRDSYLSNNTSRYVSSTTFHPHRMVLATNYNQDSHINVYNCVDVMLEY